MENIKLTSREVIILNKMAPIGSRSRKELTTCGIDLPTFFNALGETPRAAGALSVSLKKKGLIEIDKRGNSIRLTDAGYDYLFGKGVDNPDQPKKKTTKQVQKKKARFISAGKGDAGLLKYIPKQVRQYVMGAYMDENGIWVDLDPLLTPVYPDNSSVCHFGEAGMKHGKRAWFWALQGGLKSRDFKEDRVSGEVRRSHLKEDCSMMQCSVLMDMPLEAVDDLLETLGGDRKAIWHEVVLPTIGHPQLNA